MNHENQRNQNKKYYEINQKVKDTYIYYLNSPSGKEAKKYLNDRGIDDETIRKYEIGFAPDKDIIYPMLKNLGYKEIDMVKAGVVTESEYMNYHDKFKGRITFPLNNKNGKTVGFSARIFTEMQKKRGLSKYMNTSETPIFHKGNLLYNFDKCKGSTKENGKLYINEGFMDVIAMSRAGYDNSVGLMGTALTDKHIEMIKAITNNVTVCLDGDSAGMKSAIRTGNMLEKAGMEVDAVLLPKGHDPDEIYRHGGKNELDECLSKEISIGKIELEALKKEVNPESARIVEKRAIDIISEKIDEKEIISSIKEFATVLSSNDKKSTKEDYIRIMAESVNYNLRKNRKPKIMLYSPYDHKAKMTLNEYEILCEKEKEHKDPSVPIKEKVNQLKKSGYGYNKMLSMELERLHRNYGCDIKGYVPDERDCQYNALERDDFIIQKAMDEKAKGNSKDAEQIIISEINERKEKGYSFSNLAEKVHDMDFNLGRKSNSKNHEENKTTAETLIDYAKLFHDPITYLKNEINALKLKGQNVNEIVKELRKAGYDIENQKNIYEMSKPENSQRNILMNKFNSVTSPEKKSEIIKQMMADYTKKNENSKEYSHSI